MLDINWDNALKQFNRPSTKDFKLDNFDKQTINDLLATGREVVFIDKNKKLYNINKEPIDKKPDGAFIFAIEE